MRAQHFMVTFVLQSCLSLSLPELPSIAILPSSPFSSRSASPIVSLLLLFERESAEVRKRQLGCPSRDTISVRVRLHARGRDAASQLPSVLQREDPPGSVPLTTKAAHTGVPPLILESLLQLQAPCFQACLLLMQPHSYKFLVSPALCASLISVGQRVGWM